MGMLRATRRSARYGTLSHTSHTLTPAPPQWACFAPPGALLGPRSCLGASAAWPGRACGLSKTPTAGAGPRKSQSRKSRRPSSVRPRRARGKIPMRVGVKGEGCMDGWARMCEGRDGCEHVWKRGEVVDRGRAGMAWACNTPPGGMAWQFHFADGRDLRATRSLCDKIFVRQDLCVTRSSCDKT
eukprot:357410-Chlamydomonas_euryale.AAC.3